MDKFLTDDETKTKGLRAEILNRSVEKQMESFDRQYQYDFSYTAPTEPLECTNIADLVEFAREGKCEVDAKILTAKRDGKAGYTRYGTKSFVEAYDHNSKNEDKISKFLESTRHREAIDPFDFSGSDSAGSFGMVGQDYISFLGGPFDKQLYIQDYLKMHGTAFMTYNHDPLAKRALHIKREFTLGRGFRVDTDKENKSHLAYWRAVEEANKFQDLFSYIALELALYGEVMVWRLPDHQRYIQYNVQTGQESPTVFLPRYRLIDPSSIWEVVTYPEDITRVLYYKMVSPTQYQMYTGTDAGKPIPTTKFMIQQIPADQVFHFKINCVSNEKRGRSDLFPALGYLKRLRDAVNYSIISDQKNSSWAIDTSIEGSQADINAYIASQEEIGTIPPAGSEFVHSTKVVRQYLANQGKGAAASNSFDWCMSMIAAALGVPVSFFGTHLSGGQTRASAMVATEPSVKMFESRQYTYENIVRTIVMDSFKQKGLNPYIDFEVTFPEIYTQDRSAKFQDLMVAVQNKWISNRRAAQIASKEFNISEFDYETESKDIEQDSMISPLTLDPAVKKEETETEHEDISGQSRKQLADNEGY